MLAFVACLVSAVTSLRDAQQVGVERFPCEQLRRGLVKCDRSRGPKFLGEGGFGSTWLVEDASGTEKVVLKLFFDLAVRSRGGYLTANQRDRLAFLQSKGSEVRNECLPAMLVHQPGPDGSVHPGAQRVRRCLGDNFGTAVGNELFFVKLKDAGGMSLLKYQLHRAALGTWDTMAARKAIKQLLQGLHAIASIGWVHNDFSVQNAMVREVGGEFLVQIIDFGCAVPMQKGLHPATDLYFAGEVLIRLLFVLDAVPFFDMAPELMKDAFVELKYFESLPVRVKVVAEMLSRPESFKDLNKWVEKLEHTTIQYLESDLKQYRLMDDSGADKRPELEHIRWRILRAMHAKGLQAGEPFEPRRNLQELTEPAAVEFLWAAAELLHPDPEKRPPISKLLNMQWMRDTVVADNPYA